MCTLCVFAQELMMPQISVDAEYEGPMKEVTGATNSIPPCYLYKIVGYNFRIILAISFEENAVFDESLYGLVCILPDNSYKKIFFHFDEIIASTDHSYEYSFTETIREGGRIEVFIASRSDLLTDMDVRSYKHTSNREDLFLSPPK